MPQISVQTQCCDDVIMYECKFAQKGTVVQINMQNANLNIIAYEYKAA